MNLARALLWKDLVSEWRSRDRLVAMVVFSFLVVVVFQFAWPKMRPEEMTRLAPGVLWVTYLFAAVIGLGRTFAMELENDAMTALALAPGTRGWIFLGKATATWILISAVQAITAFVFALFFRQDLWTGAAGIALVAGLANVAICSVGTLLSAMSVRSRFRDVLLPVLLIPTLIPVLAAATRATAGPLAGEAPPWAALQPLIVISGVYLVLCFLLFDFVLDE
ncbi:MAG: cytochrome C biogenesis protein [Deltaproteobacteria bacterium]|nr:cytochrome C biogenesis protein [Deltaproteobacteria bacterium]